ncbi:MAG: HNH endonuclease [Candidatus Hinthialibacter antarcticus]|nr:HNH endonuclease [Candidatus Hinthialibacter antarcticus]
MTTWRMAFRVGTGGEELWPICFELGVAAITYDPLAKTDLSRYPEGEPKNSWQKLAPSQKASLKRVAYEMKKGDIIYVKQGTKIVCKGIVDGSYFFDKQTLIVDPNGVPWPHQVKVKWESEFIRMNKILGKSQQLTVEKLQSNEILSFESELKLEKKAQKQQEVLEGEKYKAEIEFRRRNSGVILAKKANSDFRCEVCGFSFEEKYGTIGDEYIIAHHLNPISMGEQLTTLDDIALVCANCHAMVHTKNPPIPIDELRKILKN